MKIVCDACSAKYSIADEKVRGKVFKIRCKKCSNIIVVRGTSEEAEAPAMAAPVDNKETKVFDYSGYDNPSEAMAAAESGDPAWHVVIDQEQVGPLTAGDVRGRFAAGQLDGESYIWKEGFGDWQRIVDVPDFADLGQPEDPGVGMFGGPPIDDNAASAGDPGDLFGAASAGASSGFGGGGDLFGGAAAADAGADDGLFGGAAASAAGGHGGDAVNVESQLRGQRNENSVLFSLNNLASLASEAPRASAAPAASSSPASQPGMAQAGGTEGSGLIDIRSMAQVYLGDRGGASGGAMPSTGSADDLPVFSQTAFESASPVLLPQQSAAANNKVIYGLIGAIGVLVLAATILLIVVFKGGSDEPAATAPAVAANAIDDEAGDEADDAPADDEGEAAAADDDEADDEAKAAAAAAAAEEPKEADKAEDEPKESTTKRERTRTASRSRDRSRSRRSAPKEKDEPKPKARDSVADATSSSGCDEVTCLVEPGKACCKKYQKSSGRRGGGSRSSSNSNLPETPTRSDISSGISKIKSRVRSCGDKHGGSGTVKVKLRIGGNGKVSSATASGGGSALRSCVVSAVKRASFRKTQKGVTVTYPFVF